MAFVLGDRANLNTQIAPDQISLTSTLLEELGHVPALDLFLYSTGGITMAAFAFVNLLREYADQFSAVVPYKALSAATLICLGADEIVMTPLASLSPVDPSVTGPYNPLVPNQQPGMPPQGLPVSVEDVVEYIDLARVDVGLSSDADMREVFLQLARDVRPLALGSVRRARTQIRMLSRKLLESHPANQSKVRAWLGAWRTKKIVDALTKKLFSHDYTISRREARTLGLNVADPDAQTANAIMALYREYERDLRLLQPYNPDVELGQAPTITVTLERAYIETAATGWGFVSQHELSRIQVPVPGVMAQIVARAVSEGWRRL
ncbi:MAG: hypothetical protein DMD33_17935 [Gemmatimonadetes bacterium]|nr:MAG: hypothetical protein DMD33_17935 [Gemmatimonadota bacterium]